jgi:hypothetical protein
MCCSGRGRRGGRTGFCGALPPTSVVHSTQRVSSTPSYLHTPSSSPWLNGPIPFIYHTNSVVFPAFFLYIYTLSLPQETFIHFFFHDVRRHHATPPIAILEQREINKLFFFLFRKKNVDSILSLQHNGIHVKKSN